MEECGKRSLRPALYLVPLELDCRHDDDALRLCPRDPQGNEEDDDDDDDEEDAAIATNEDSLLAENQGGSNVSADAEGQEFLPDASYAESLHHTLGSSRTSGLANGTTTGCKIHTNATPNTVSPSLPPTTVVTQPREGEERDAGRGAATTTTRPQRRAARRQRVLLGRLIRDDQL